MSRGKGSDTRKTGERGEMRLRWIVDLHLTLEAREKNFKQGVPGSVSWEER
jgi:hypothetical protein